MNEIEVSSIDLVEGGNVFKQGHYLTLGYIPRDESGGEVDLSGKTLGVTLWGRKGIGFEADAVYADGVLRFTLNETIPAGEYNVEFTATSSTDATYRKKFPTSASSGRIVVRQSADDLGAIGVQVVTVAQLKAEQQALQTSYEQTVDGKIVELETTVTEGIGAFTEDTEVINARQGKATLGENLTGITAQLADIVTVNIKSRGSMLVVDWRSIINTAIVEVGQAGGGVVLIPKGVFDIGLDPNTRTGIINRYSNVRITGEGTLRLKDNQLSGALTYSPTMILIDTFSSNETDLISNITVENITIDQNRENNFCSYIGYSADALTIRHCDNPLIKDVKFKNVIDSALMLTSNKNFLVKNNHFDTAYRYCKVSTTAGSTTVTSNNANFTAKDIGKYMAIKKAGVDGSAIFGSVIKTVISSNTVELHHINIPISVSVIDADALICNSDAAIYVSDFWLATSDSPIPFSPENKRGDRTEDGIISGNRIKGFAQGIHCNRGTSRLLITENKVRHCHLGMDLSFETTNFTAIPHKNVVTDNTFESCYRIGIAMNNAHLSIISNNLILDTSIGIDTAGSSYCTISDNIIVGDLIASSYHVGIMLSRGFKDGIETFASYNTISGNVVSKFWFGVKDQAGCIGNIFNANQLKGNRSETDKSALYSLVSTHYCLDGIWYADVLSDKVFPTTKGTIVMESNKLRVYDGATYRTLSNYRSTLQGTNATAINALDATFVLMNNYSVATNVTSITNGEVGQELTLYMTNTNVTLVNSENLRLSGKANFAAPARTTIKFVCIDGTIWAEVSRVTQ